jgi:hypothetical protein
MKKMDWAGMGLICLLAGAGAVLAQPADSIQGKPQVTTATAEEAPKSSSLQERIDLKVTKADGREVLMSLATMLSANLELDPTVVGDVTFSLEDTPVQQVLSLLCQSMDCDWRYTEGSDGKAPELMILKLPPPPKK